MKFSKRVIGTIEMDEKAMDALVHICGHFLINNTATGSDAELAQIVAHELRDELNVLIGRGLPPQIGGDYETLP